MITSYFLQFVSKLGGFSLSSFPRLVGLFLLIEMFVQCS